MDEKIKELEKRIETMEKAQNLDQNVLLFEGLLNKKGSYDATLQRTISGSIGADGGSYSFIVPEDPINSLQLNYKGVNYRILLYSLS